MTDKSHYDLNYFEWQKKIGRFGGQANLFKFIGEVKPTDHVLDFGCGGGYLLAQLPCQSRLGVEVNPTAVKEAQSQGIVCHASVETVPDGWADVIISNSTLEHTPCPLDELKRLYPKLKAGGKIIFSVPCESADWHYAPGDINQHLYTWSPMSLGNLFTTAGFSVVKVDVYRIAWPPFSRKIMALCGETIFRALCRLYWMLRWLLSSLKPMKIAASVCVVATR